jgi:hypothetical protein
MGQKVMLSAVSKSTCWSSLQITVPLLGQPQRDTWLAEPTSPSFGR